MDRGWRGKGPDIETLDNYTCTSIFRRKGNSVKGLKDARYIITYI